MNQCVRLRTNHTLRVVLSAREAGSKRMQADLNAGLRLNKQHSFGPAAKLSASAGLACAEPRTDPGQARPDVCLIRRILEFSLQNFRFGSPR